MKWTVHCAGQDATKQGLENKIRKYFINQHRDTFERRNLPVGIKSDVYMNLCQPEMHHICK